MKELIGLREAATRLGIHISTIRAWVRVGRIPSYGVGERFRRVSWEEVLDALSRDGDQEEVDDR